MKYFKILIFTLIVVSYHNISFSKEIYFVDLKKKFENENKKFKKEGADIRKEETDLIAKKKIISPEEYKKSLNSLREKSVDYQNRRRQASNNWVKKKNEARAKLLEVLNPIMQKYMKENNVELIIDK